MSVEKWAAVVVPSQVVSWFGPGGVGAAAVGAGKEGSCQGFQGGGAGLQPHSCTCPEKDTLHPLSLSLALVNQPPSFPYPLASFYSPSKLPSTRLGCQAAVEALGARPNTAVLSCLPEYGPAPYLPKSRVRREAPVGKDRQASRASRCL